MPTLGYLEEATFLATLPLVSPTARHAPCRKCGHAVLDIAYCRGPGVARYATPHVPLDCSNVVVEHFHAACARCHFPRLERTLESVALALAEIAYERLQSEGDLTSRDRHELADAEAVLHQRHHDDGPILMAHQAANANAAAA